MVKLKRTFPTGGPVSAEDLVDRENILRELMTRTYEHGNSIVISGPRQTGKTSVADELVRRVRKAGGWAVYIDCSRTTDDEGELAHMIARSTYDQMSGSKGAFAALKDFISGVPKPVFFQGDLDLALMFNGRAPDPPSVLLERALGLADEIAGAKNKRCVVIYDEFQTLRKVSDTLFTRARAILQHHMEHTAYVFMGSEVGLLDELFKNPEQMPFGLAVPLNLGVPNGGAWRKYIAARFREFKVSLTSAEIDELLDFCGGHPRDLMELCEHLLTVRSLNPDISGTLEIAKKRTLNSLRPQFDEIWKRLEKPIGTQITATRIANHQAIYGPGRPHKSVARTLEKLEREGVIHKVARGNYEFTEPLFGYYVQELQG